MFLKQIGMFVVYGAATCVGWMVAGKAMDIAQDPIAKAKVKRIVKNIKNEFSNKD